MFEPDPSICLGFIQAQRDSICDVATVWERNRQTAFSSEPPGNRHTDGPDDGAHEGNARAAQGATANMHCTYMYVWHVHTYIYIYTQYIHVCICIQQIHN